MRLLITGASGLLGGRLAQLLAPRHPLWATRHRGALPEGVAAVEADLARPGALAEAVERARPDAIVHCAALADVDACERDPESARALNAELPGELGRVAASAGVRAVSVSTDLVFDGGRAGWRPGDAAHPVMLYGRSKLEGERRLLDADPDAVVVRVALIVGRGCGARASASEALERGIRAGRRPRLFTDQYRTPIDPESVAAAIEALLAGRAGGVFHLGGPERVSRYELGRRVAAARGLDAGALVPVLQDAEPPAVPRPRDVSLDSDRARRELGWRPRPLDEALRESREDGPERG